jgi:hypothetical protein
MRLLDLLREHELWLCYDDGGDEWDVEGFITEWIAGHEPGDLGPEVMERQEPGGIITVFTLNEGGSPGEKLGELYSGF